ncbi:hypothetical protein [Streptomyces sp. H51]|uniref:hypothetical protein n=1 Tax=Streptomyces sp. H51 TaxID=3111770 RepID=UPI002D79DB14|nr:hypothetical protein [Streptomyces sp. H51]
MMIDAILAFHDDLAELPGPHARSWQLGLASATERCLRPLTGGLPARRWLVHARHRTQTRPHPTLDRQIYESWIPHLTAALRGLIGEAAAAAGQAKRARQPAAMTHLLRARHNLQHACRHLNQRGRSDNVPSPTPPRNAAGER